MIIDNPEVEILLPVRNEGASIEIVMREIRAKISPRVALQFLSCEDGSVDNEDVLRKLDGELPVSLMIATEQKGYSPAVRNGMRALSAPWLLCIGSDGRFGSKEFWKFWEQRKSHDVTRGRWAKRLDFAWRRFFCRGFYLEYAKMMPRA